MNWYVGGATGSAYDSFSTSYVLCLALGDAVKPADLFAFIDTHEDSVLGGLFQVWAPPPGPNCQIPGNRHARGLNLSFLDGHVEHKRWSGIWGTVSVERNQLRVTPEPSGEDYYWLWERATTKREP